MCECIIVSILIIVGIVVAFLRMKKKLLKSIELEMNQEKVETKPKHIFDVLDDGCIQVILQKLTNVNDFLRVAETCICFQENAKQCYPSSFKSISIKYTTDEMEVTLPLAHVPSFLKTFGDLICSLQFHGGSIAVDKQNNVFTKIVDYCSETLCELLFDEVNIDLSRLSLFTSLKKLYIKRGPIKNLKFTGILQELILSDVELDMDSKWLNQGYPNLKKAEFLSVKNLKNMPFITFLKLNLQLQSLATVNCVDLKKLSLKNSRCLLNLVEFNCCILFVESDSDYMNLVSYLSNLVQLRRLTFRCYNFPTKPLIDSIAEKMTSLEELGINGYHHGLKDCISSLVKLSQLKKIRFFGPGSVPGKLITDIVKSLPGLETVEFKSLDINLEEIKEILKHGKQLKQLKVRTYKMDVDLPNFESILELNKIKVNVELQIANGQIDENIVTNNKKWLNISQVKHF